MTSDRKLKTLYIGAYDFLKQRMGKEALEHKLNHYRQYRAETMQDVFWHMLNSLTNKVGMRATIGDIDPLGAFLFNFDPYQTYAHYNDDWRKLFKIIKNNHTPPGPMKMKKENSFWAIFCKGILSGAEFLTTFDSFESFDKFVFSFSFNDISIAGLPILIDNEVYGMGFPLACDFLKELGYRNYGKPDTHTITILYEIGVAPSRSVYDIFKTMVKVAKANDQTTVIVDYILWLIGSGKYVGENETIVRQKQAFIQEIKPKLE